MKTIEQRIEKIERILKIEDWPCANLRRCKKCGHEETYAYDNICPNVYCSGGFTEIVEKDIK